eukprot:6977821-Alexandrium_andersonii.AAC.1
MGTLLARPLVSPVASASLTTGNCRALYGPLQVGADNDVRRVSSSRRRGGPATACGCRRPQGQQIPLAWVGRWVAAGRNCLSRVSGHSFSRASRA